MKYIRSMKKLAYIRLICLDNMNISFSYGYSGDKINMFLQSPDKTSVMERASYQFSPCSNDSDYVKFIEHIFSFLESDKVFLDVESLGWEMESSL